MVKHRTLAGVAAAATAAIALVLSGCTSSPGQDATGTAGDKPTLVIGAFSPVYQTLIQESGLWDDAPYELQLFNGSFNDQIAGLNAGQVDIAFYGATTALRQDATQDPQWTAETSPIKVIAGWYAPNDQDVPGAVTVYRTDAGIDPDDPSTLKGKTWGVGVGGDVPTVFYATLKRDGLTKSDVNVQANGSYAPIYAGLRSGQIQIATIGPAEVSDLIQDGTLKILDSASDFGIVVFQGYAVRTEELADATKEPLIKDFIQRFGEFNTTWIDGHPDDYKQALVDVGQDTEQVADFQVQQRKGTYAYKFDDTFYQGVQTSADLLYWAGDIPVPVTDVKATFDDRYNDLIDAQTVRFR